MEFLETHNNPAQPSAGVPPSEQHKSGTEAATLTSIDMDKASTAPLQPAYQPPADGGNQQPMRKRSWKVYVLGVTVLVILMLASFGVGRALVGSPSGSASPATSNNAAITLPPSVFDLQQAIIEIANKVQPSVVEVTSTGRTSEAIGSGIILTSDGYIATNDHVVSGYSSFTVRLSDGKMLPAQLVGQDPQDDLAVLKIAATNLQPITFADSSQVQVGEFALALGSPLGLENSTTFGIVSAVNRVESEAPSGPASELTGLIQTSAPINPGNSGGALINLQGQLIGMPTLGASDSQNGGTANDIGFAIPSNRIKFVTDQLIASGRLTSTGQGFLGIEGQDVTAQLAAASGLSAQQGVLVTSFAHDTAGTARHSRRGCELAM